MFFAYIGFDAISTAAEETKNPQRNLPIGILGGLAICTLIYVIVGAVLTGMVPYKELGRRRPARARARARRASDASAGSSRSARWSRCRRCCWCSSTASRASSSRWRATACCRSGRRTCTRRRRCRTATTIITGMFVASWSLIGDAGETYDLTNIGTLFAFMLVCIGVLVLRYKEPDRPRPFRVPFVWPVCVLSAAGCVFIMYGLPRQAWERFGMVAGDRPRAVLRLRLQPQPTPPTRRACLSRWPRAGARPHAPAAGRLRDAAARRSRRRRDQDRGSARRRRHADAARLSRRRAPLFRTPQSRQAQRDARSAIAGRRGGARRARRDAPTSSSRAFVHRRRGGSASTARRCCARHPRLVCASIERLRAAGPDAERAAHDINYQALAGLLRPPPLPGPLVGDIGAAMQAAIGILAALLARQHTGAGGAGRRRRSRRRRSRGRCFRRRPISRAPATRCTKTADGAMARARRARAEVLARILRADRPRRSDSAAARERRPKAARNPTRFAPS